ncbi:MAG: diguanylate cyclase, partial [Actinobacteria bacterium]|nr:diguanylate cyclase [Actinomycetota bacterium]
MKRKFWATLSLYKKMLIIFAVFIIISIAAALLINQFIILRSFMELEKELIVKRVEGVEKLIDNMVDNLNSTCIDWAHWDDSYQFIQNENQDYINSNYTDAEDTLKTLKLDFVIYVNLDGQIIYSKFYDPMDGLEKPLPNSLVNFVSPISDSRALQNFNNTDENNNLKGLLLLDEPDENIFLLSSNSILTCTGKGPSKGTLIMGYALDDEIEELSALTDSEIQFFNLNNIQNHTEFSRILNESAARNYMKISYETTDRYSAFDILQDISGNDNVLLKVSGVREIYLHGRTTAAILALTVSFSTLILSVITLFALNILFFKRVHNLSLSVKKIGDEKNISKRLDVEGNDEITSVAKDINKMLDEIENSQNQIIKTQNMYKELFENSLDDIYRSNPDGQYISVNNALVRMLGYGSKEELLKVNTKDLYYYQETRPDINERTRSFNKILKKKDGTKIFVEISPRVIYDKENKVYYEGIVRDVTAQREFDEKLKYISFHDSLTDLYNRTYFDEELKRLKNTRQLPLTIVMGDVNGLKEINDTYGHEKGDIMLKKIARILKYCFRSDDMIARIGGDEFCIILHNTSK